MKCNFQEEGLRGEDALAPELFDLPVEIAKNELYTPLSDKRGAMSIGLDEVLQIFTELEHQ